MEVAKSQEADRAQTLAGYSSRSEKVAQAGVRLRELERDAQANQNLYESFLDRYKSALQFGAHRFSFCVPLGVCVIDLRTPS
jgi:uncharacterized protein involved in exopolysaccharide biosynthesis